MNNSEGNLLHLLKSENDQNQEIGVQILKSKGLSDVEIIRFFRENEVCIPEKRAFEAGILSSENWGNLLKCINCEGDEFDVITLDTLGYIVCEEEHTCKNCKQKYYWGYGHFDLNGFC